MTAINICIERVDVLFADDQARGALAVSRTINLLDLRDGVTTVLGISQFPVGVIHQVRLILCPDGATVIVNGVEQPLEVPSGEHTGIKLNSPGGFEILENVTTTIVIDFDAGRSTHYAPGQGWMLTPVVELVEKAIVLAVTYPAPGAVVGAHVIVKGTVASKLPLTQLSVNGVDAVVSGVDWQVEVSLPYGNGHATIIALAVDQLGRTAEVTFDVVTDNAPPLVEVTDPFGGAGVFSASSVTVKGIAADLESGIAAVSVETELDAIPVRKRSRPHAAASMT